VIAVSDYIAQRLAGIVAPERLHVIPNMLDIAALDAALATPPASVASGIPYLLFVGKLERNKGAHLLIEIFRTLVNERRKMEDEAGAGEDDSSAFGLRPSSPIPELVIAGSGPLRADLERELAALGVRVRFLDWVDHDEILRLMAHCVLLLFPSGWGEPLSRVLLEAMACGAPILAMPTGGTPGVIRDGVDGALEPTLAGFARRLAGLLARKAERTALGAAARQMAQERYAKETVLERMENLYRSLI
jgi:glycosyltransferase involved in cell wall biosynthesis